MPFIDEIDAKLKSVIEFFGMKDQECLDRPLEVLDVLSLGFLTASCIGQFLFGEARCGSLDFEIGTNTLNGPPKWAKLKKRISEERLKVLINISQGRCPQRLPSSLRVMSLRWKTSDSRNFWTNEDRFVTDEIVVRTANVGDEAVLSGLCAVVHDLHQRERPDVFKQVDIAVLERWFEDLLAAGNAKIWIAYLRNTPVGYAVVVDQVRAEPSLLTRDGGMRSSNSVSIRTIAESVLEKRFSTRSNSLRLSAECQTLN